MRSARALSSARPKRESKSRLEEMLTLVTIDTGVHGTDPPQTASGRYWDAKYENLAVRIGNDIYTPSGYWEKGLTTAPLSAAAHDEVKNVREIIIERCIDLDTCVGASMATMKRGTRDYILTVTKSFQDDPVHVDGWGDLHVELNGPYDVDTVRYNLYFLKGGTRTAIRFIDLRGSETYAVSPLPQR